MKSRQKSSLCPLCWAVVCAAVALVPQVVGAASSHRPYVIRLPNQYCIYAPLRRTGDSAGPHLWKKEDGVYSSVGDLTSMPIREYAASGDIVFGTTPEGFYILDTRQGLAQDVERVHLFTEVPAWRAKLSELDVLLDYGSLRRPDAVVRELTEREARPWRFRQMRGSWGLSDADWGFLVVAFGLAGSLALGVLVGGQVLRRAGAAILGLASAIVGPFIIGGGGPAAGVALMACPFLAMLAAEIGLRVRRALGRALA